MRETSREVWAALGGRVLLLLVVVGALLLVLGAVAAHERSERVERAWTETLGSLEQLLAAFPTREANEAALAVEALTAPLGIDIATRSHDGRTRPTERASHEYREFKATIGDYYQRQLERPGPAIDAPPPALDAYLARHAADLTALRRQLIDGPPPRWELAIDRLAEAPIPNLLGHIDAQKLLVADALVAARNGDDERALADLEAAWRLNAALREDPILITQLISIASTRLQTGALRKLDRVPDVWRDRLVEHDYRDSMLRALRLEAWIWPRLDGEDALGMSHGGRLPRWQRLLVRLARPYVRFCLAETSERMRVRLERLAELEYLCDRDLAADGADLDVEIPRWNLVAPRVVPGLAGAIHRVARLELDLELTRKLLALRAARDRDGGWPDRLPGIERSQACPADRWRYEPGPDGAAMSIAFERPIGWPDQMGAILPTAYATDGP